ncbi:hypothetical protein BDR04DRAFT_1123718 [Suillus decipiens]|nr:hypothetical protein BDR04DRAFT_1123718 [Suillus decipiens]
MIPPPEWKLRVPGCESCVAENEACYSCSPASACKRCRKLCSLFQDIRPRFAGIMRAVRHRYPMCQYCSSTGKACQGLEGEACFACHERCSNVVKDAQDPDSADASDAESQISDSSEEVVSLDGQPSDWVEKPLDEKARERLRAEQKDLEQHLAKVQDMHRRAEEACRELEHELNHLKRCLVD